MTTIFGYGVSIVFGIVLLGFISLVALGFFWPLLETHCYRLLFLIALYYVIKVFKTRIGEENGQGKE